MKNKKTNQINSGIWDVDDSELAYQEDLESAQQEEINKKTKKQIKKYAILIDSIGCKIRGEFTDDEIKRLTSKGKWTVTIEETN